LVFFSQKLPPAHAGEKKYIFVVLTPRYTTWPPSRRQRHTDDRRNPSEQVHVEWEKKSCTGTPYRTYLYK
jgi:hypothetical protein